MSKLVVINGWAYGFGIGIDYRDDKGVTVGVCDLTLQEALLVANEIIVAVAGHQVMDDLCKEHDDDDDE